MLGRPGPSTTRPWCASKPTTTHSIPNKTHSIPHKTHPVLGKHPVHRFQYLTRSASTQPLIGIASAGPILGTDSILWRQTADKIHDGLAIKPSKPLAGMDHNHSHFLLVENEDGSGFGAENALRGEFEQCLSAAYAMHVEVCHTIVKVSTYILYIHTECRICDACQGASYYTQGVNILYLTMHMAQACPGVAYVYYRGADAYL